VKGSIWSVVVVIDQKRARRTINATFTSKWRTDKRQSANIKVSINFRVIFAQKPYAQFAAFRRYDLTNRTRWYSLANSVGYRTV